MFLQTISECFTKDLEREWFDRSLQSAENVDKKLKILHAHFLRTINLHSPLRKLTKKEIRTSLKPWITKTFLNLSS